MVQRCLFWQMENGCPFMMSWNTAKNVGFITARDSDVIAHERTYEYGPDGLVRTTRVSRGSCGAGCF